MSDHPLGIFLATSWIIKLNALMVEDEFLPTGDLVLGK
jgi:hypothetical protein